MGPNIPVTKGLHMQAVRSIPDKWDPQWFKRFIANHMQKADFRNATAGNGISITGTEQGGGTIALSGTMTGPITINSAANTFPLTVNSSGDANHGAITATNSAPGGIELQLFGTSNGAGLKGWCIRVGSTGAFAIDTTTDAGVDLNGGFIMGRDASGNVTTAIINQNVAGAYAFVVNEVAVGSKGVQINNTSGGVSLYSYSDGSGSGWSNTDPQTSGALLYLDGINFMIYSGGTQICYATNAAGGITPHSAIQNNGAYGRTATNAGFLDGIYSTVETGNTPGAIYCLGGGHYVPTTTTLGVMYGIGYTLGGISPSLIGPNIPGLASQAQQWGFYAVSGGVERIFLSSDTGYGWSSAGWVGGGKMCNRSNDATVPSAGGLISSQSGGTASGGNPGDIILIY